MGVVCRRGATRRNGESGWLARRSVKSAYITVFLVLDQVVDRFGSGSVWNLFDGLHLKKETKKQKQNMCNICILINSQMLFFLIL